MMSLMAKPARPDLVFHSIDDLLADAARLRSGPYTQAGNWDLPMILDHLGKAMETPSPNQKPVLWPLDIVARVMIHLLAKRTYYPRIKFPAAKAMQPKGDVSLETAEAAFRSAAEKIKSLPGPRVSGTPFGTLFLDDFMKLHLLHGAHHLSFLSPV
jgi:hypothetical protein